MVLAGCLLLAAWLLRDGFGADRVLVATDPLGRSLPWSDVLETPVRHNTYLVDQPRLYWPYLTEAARVFAGEADPVWTSRGGGGQPFLGNISSALAHPLTWLVVAFPVHLVPWIQGVLTLALSAFFTWLFLRRLGASPPAAGFGAVAFGFGGHQVLWLQYALSHTLLALPFAFWATERLVEDPSRRRVAILGLAFALFVVGGHPETGYVAGLVAGLWALYRLWDAFGRLLVLGAGLLGLALSAVQWMPFLEYAQLSHGLRLRELENARVEGGVSFGASLVYAVLFLGAVAMLRSAASKGATKRVLAVGACALSMVMARRMGMAVSSGVVLLPEMYGNPQGGGVFTAAQDFPGLNAGYAGILPPTLLALGFFVGLGHGFIRFFAITAVLLWGAAFHLPGVEYVVRLVPGLTEVAPTRLLGPVGFATACGGALVIDRLCAQGVKPGVLVGVGRLVITIVLALGLGALVLRLPGGEKDLVRSPNLRGPDPQTVHSGTSIIPICLDIHEPVDDLRISVDGLVLRSGQAAITLPGEPLTVRLMAYRMEEGRHRLVVEAINDGQVTVLADQPLQIGRARQLSTRDLMALALALGALGWMVSRPRGSAPWVLAVVAGLDVLSLAEGYNEGSDRADLFPPTETGAFLAEQQPPFRIFTQGLVAPPDTQFELGVDHLLSYDNLGYDRTYRWLTHVPIQMDAFASFSFSQENVDYASRRFDTLDVRYVLTAKGTDLSAIPGMRLVHESEARVWENTDNLGRAFVVGQALDVHTEPVQRLLEADTSRVGLLEHRVPPLGGTGRVTRVDHRGREIDVSVEADGDVLVILAENRAPGWEVSVDGGPWQETLHADMAWQGVFVGDGKHDLRFRYDPPGYRWGLRISLLGAVLWLLMLLFPRHLS